MDSLDPRETVQNEQDSSSGIGTTPLLDAANPAKPLTVEPENSEVAENTDNQTSAESKPESPEVGETSENQASPESESETLDAIINFRSSTDAEASTEEALAGDDPELFGLSTDEVQEISPEPSFDYSTLGKSDLIKVLSNLIEMNPPEKIRQIGRASCRERV